MIRAVPSLVVLNRRAVGLLTLALLLAGCSSPLVRVGPEPPKGYRIGETVQGRACGILVSGMIPVRVGSRTERAYKSALGNRGAGLVDTKIRHTWHAIPMIGLVLCTEIEGKVIQ